MAPCYGIKLSRRQLEVLEALKSFTSEHRYVPSVRELAREVNRSPSTVYQHLKALKQKGYLHSDGTPHGWDAHPEEEIFQRGSSHAGEYAARPYAATTSAGKASNVGHNSFSATVSVPVRGTIAAGMPIEAIDAPDEALHLPSEMARDGCYALRVRGRSMEDDHILDGDIVIVHPQPTVENGTVAVALLDDGTATLKRVYQEKRRIRLQPANSEMSPFYVDQVTIQGKVVGLVRQH